jgi:hypothetical protein
VIEKDDDCLILKRNQRNDIFQNSKFKFLFADTLTDVQISMFENSMIEIAFCPKVIQIYGEKQRGGFSYCNQLRELYFPSLVKVGESGFRGCYSIEKLNLPNL